jgi:Domain of unknown function (DUF1707)
MTDERSIRASDQDRESASELLSEAYAVGRLNREELDERAAAAYSAKTWGELRDLTADLPPLALLPATRTGLPAQRGSRRSDLHLIALLIWSFLLPLGSGLAGPVSPVAVWLATLVITVALLRGGVGSGAGGRDPKASSRP